MTREEQQELKRRQSREKRRKDREAWQAARGPVDLPFLLLTLMLLAIGLIMLLSTSFPPPRRSRATPCTTSSVRPSSPVSALWP